jgi:hypothetical protein
MVYKALALASLGLSFNGAEALRVATPSVSRTSGISMGLSVGDKLPASVAKTCGVSGKKAVIFFFGADDAPSCSKEISAFEAAKDEFVGSGVSVVGYAAVIEAEPLGQSLV